MAANPFDIYDDPDVAVTASPKPATSPRGPNPFDQFDSPDAQAARLEVQKAPVTAADRVHAAEGGILGGTAYLAASPLDTVANSLELGKAALGALYGAANTTETADPLRTPGGLYHYLTPQGVERYSKDPPPSGAKPVVQSHPALGSTSAFDIDSGPSPVGGALTRYLDTNPGGLPLSTQPDRPDDPYSRYLATAGTVVPGAIVGGGGALAPSARALAAGVPSVIAGRAVAEARPFESDAANNTASVLTQALAAGAAPYAGKALIRGVRPTVGGVLTGAAPDEMGENIAAFRNAGAESTLGQAAGTRRAQFLESGLSKIPGGAGVLEAAAKTQAADLRGGVDASVARLAPGGTSPERAGRAITQGITGDGGFRDQFNTKAQTLFDEVDRHIPAASPIDVSTTLATLDAIAKPNPLAPKTTAALINPKVAAIRDALQSDLTPPPAAPAPTPKPYIMEPGMRPTSSSTSATGSVPSIQPSAVNGKTLPYGTLADLRSKVGSMLTGSELVTDIPRAQVKRLYGALTTDMRSAAFDAGPDAAQAFSRASSFYSAGMKRMDALSNVLDKNGGPEQVFNGAMSGTKDGATQLRAVMQSLAPDQQQVLAATTFRRMGQATAGNQNAAGDVFSPETFLTNYSRMSPEAKSALFDRVPGLREQADNLANVAGNLREGSKVFRNASGTAPAENQTHSLRALLLGGLMGGEGVHAFGPKGMALAATVPATAYGAARAVTSPTVVNWAARPALGSASQLASALAVTPNMSRTDPRHYQSTVDLLRDPLH